MRRRTTGELDQDFVGFVQRRGRAHLRTAVLLTGDWHTAEDLLQTCLAKLYRIWPRLDSAVDPDSYLRRMLVNTHRSWWRARWRREAPVGVVPDHAAGADAQDRHAIADTVRQALAALPPASGPSRPCWPRPPATGRPPPTCCTRSGARSGGAGSWCRRWPRWPRPGCWPRWR